MMITEDIILGIDYGLSHLGLASSTSGQIASPLGVVETKDKPLEKIANAILSLTAPNKIKTLVVGISEGTMAVNTEKWAKDLANVLQLSGVEFVDETLSSVEAGDEKNNHAKSAAIILQRYLDNHN